ncbi:MAG: hypothetical protein L7F78_19175, partial [Syntrophales bacterium LBB04]|nr:hypothetical protein [Syntrophales bacterium LBB04]
MVYIFPSSFERKVAASTAAIILTFYQKHPSLAMILFLRGYRLYSVCRVMLIQLILAQFELDAVHKGMPACVNDVGGHADRAP